MKWPSSNAPAARNSAGTSSSVLVFPASGEGPNPGAFPGKPNRLAGQERLLIQHLEHFPTEKPVPTFSGSALGNRRHGFKRSASRRTCLRDANPLPIRPAQAPPGARIQPPAGADDRGLDEDLSEAV